MTKFIARLVVGTAVAVALAGCSNAPNDRVSETSTASASAVAAIDAGPVELTSDEAGTRYLNIICPQNFGVQALTDAFSAGEDEFRAGGDPDPAAVKASAADRIVTARLVVDFLDAEYFLWPEEVRDQIPLVRDSSVAELSTLDGIVNAVSYEDAYYATWPDFTAAGTAAQEIRYQLGLDADTTASCTGYEGGHDTLTAETTAREALLAEQESTKD
ncbi:hypothetical protein [Cryobacterium sp. AP23]